MGHRRAIGQFLGRNEKPSTTKDTKLHEGKAGKNEFLRDPWCPWWLMVFSSGAKLNVSGPGRCKTFHDRLAPGER
jgi:hypothetical protein